MIVPSPSTGVCILARCTSRRSGVSMVELIVAVLITGILSAVAAPRLVDAGNQYRINATADRIASDLKQARQHARSTGTSETVTFNLSLGKYALSSARSLDGTSAAYSVDLTEYPYNATLSKVSFGGSQTVTFDGYGFPDNAGSVTVSASGLTREITVAPSTGIIEHGGD